MYKVYGDVYSGNCYKVKLLLITDYLRAIRSTFPNRLTYCDSIVKMRFCKRQEAYNIRPCNLDFMDSLWFGI